MQCCINKEPIRSLFDTSQLGKKSVKKVWWSALTKFYNKQRPNTQSQFIQKAISTDSPDLTPMTYALSLSYLFFLFFAENNNLTNMIFFGHILCRISSQSLLLTQALCMPATNLCSTKNPQIMFAKFIWSKIAAAKALNFDRCLFCG